MAMSSAGEEADWLRSMLIDIPLWSKPIPPLTIYYGNQAATFRLQVLAKWQVETSSSQTQSCEDIIGGRRDIASICEVQI